MKFFYGEGRPWPRGQAGLVRWLVVWSWSEDVLGL